MFNTVVIKYKSKFYAKEKREYWWKPNAIENELKCWINYLNEISVYNKKQKQEIILCRYNEQLLRYTIIYQKISMDLMNAYHYGLNVEYICKNEVYKNNYKFLIKFIFFIMYNCRSIFSLNLVYRMMMITYENSLYIKEST